MASKMSAEDLKHHLRIATQPSLLTDDDLVIDGVFEGLVDGLKNEYGITLRRLDNALAVVHVPEPAKRQIRKAFGATD